MKVGLKVANHCFSVGGFSCAGVITAGGPRLCRREPSGVQASSAADTYYLEYYGFATVGKLEAFDPDTDSITVYLERVEIYFAANSIPGEKRVAVLLSQGGKYMPYYIIVGSEKAC